MKNIICGMKRRGGGGGFKEEERIMVEAKEVKDIKKGSDGGWMEALEDEKEALEDRNEEVYDG
jgi:hypothetical protein